MLPPDQGRILRLKQGYNPNSSSIGTIVFAFPGALLGMTAAFGVAAGLITSFFMSQKERRSTVDTPTTDGPRDAPASTTGAVEPDPTT